MIVGAIAAFLIPAATLFFIYTGNTKKVVNLDPSTQRSIVGSKYTVRARTKMPELKLTDIDNKLFNVTDYKGKVVLIQFWGFWDPNCTKILPAQMSLHEQYNKRPFEILGVNTDSSKEDFEVGMQKFKLAWRNVKNLQPDGSSISVEVGAKISPTLILVDHSGNVQNIWEGTYTAEELNTAVEALVKSAEAAAATAKASEQAKKEGPPAQPTSPK